MRPLTAEALKLWPVIGRVGGAAKLSIDLCGGVPNSIPSLQPALSWEQWHKKWTE